MRPGCIFFALTGPNFDGNAFAAQALDAGAVAAVVADATLQGDRYIHVTDTLAALQALAVHHRDRLRIPVIGITGSNGKTTTKEMLQHVLSGKYKTYATAGNLNNHIGVPLSLLGIDQSVEIAVIEMGANHVGEIAALCTLSKPTHGVITNIGHAHIEGFGGLEGVKRGKSELYDALAEVDGVAFVNTSQPYLTELSDSVPRRVLYGFGAEPACHDDRMTFVREESNQGIVLQVRDRANHMTRIQSDLFGAYNAHNVATAVAMGLYFDVPLGVVRDRIGAYRPENNRSQRLQIGSNVLILDAYNANPTSMALALESFAQLDGAKSLILGEMRELGATAVEAHHEIVSQVIARSWQHVFLVGDLFKEPAQDHGLPWFEDADAVIRYLQKQHFKQHTFLVKGSRSVQLERVLEAFQDSSRQA